MPKNRTNRPAALPGVRSRKRVADNPPLPTDVVFDPADLRLFIKYVPPSDLKPPRRALRKYSKRAMARMKRAISEFGFLVPIAADSRGRIIVGYSELKQLVLWKKHSAGMGSFYRSQHELIFVWKSGNAAHVNNFGLGETGRHRSNVWDYRGNAGFHRERNDDLVHAAAPLSPEPPP